ncbi:c-type cytochrome [Paracoccus tegillarcae]|uniref:Cytochrome C n=1 Tax=Paracoccus tegillarcae TaxID=1529068 RepID=A0A2K9EBH3_9RHOB|nr:cytochrome C [Paracoccus tegillarcae]AUH32248.1 cytochrome C [Paracoccus tegillarcae]
MKLAVFSVAAIFSVVTPTIAQDVANGEKEFRKCKACHMIQDADGTDIVKGGGVGPNLWNVVGRNVASLEGFSYGDGIASVAAANPDMVWDEAHLTEYVTDPQAWIDANGGDGKTKMTFKMRKAQEDLVAYLVSVSPDAPAGDSADAADADAPAASN